MNKIGTCPDCGEKKVALTCQGICEKCRVRKFNMKSRGKEYIPIINLSKEEKQKVQNRRRKEEDTNNIDDDLMIAVKSARIDQSSILSRDAFTKMLEEYGCEITEDNLNELLEVLLATDKLKSTIMTIAKDDCQQAMLNLEQALNVLERKLQHNWEYNGFNTEDEIKFKGFLTWRRTLKGAIFFWKKLYQTNVVVELQKAWNAYVSDPNEKLLLAGDKITSDLKRFQITTETISTILNTRRPFTRIFYAQTEDDAHEIFVKWLTDRQLHEDPKKTTIVELGA